MQNSSLNNATNSTPPEVIARVNCDHFQHFGPLFPIIAIVWWLWAAGLTAAIAYEAQLYWSKQKKPSVFDVKVSSFPGLCERQWRPTMSTEFYSLDYRLYPVLSFDSDSPFLVSRPFTQHG